MGVTYVEATVSGPSDEEVTLNLLVDSGVQYTVLPQAVWRKLRLRGADD